MLEKIISGGQTGVDRAALEVALDLDLDYGGWCPKGRIDENGIIPAKYEKLTEIDGDFYSEKENYDARTKKNIQASDGTLILVPSIPLPEKIKDGTLLTIDLVKSVKKPHLIIDLSKKESLDIDRFREWIGENGIETLNIAGPGESSSPSIYTISYAFLKELIPELVKTNSCVCC